MTFWRVVSRGRSSIYSSIHAPTMIKAATTKQVIEPSVIAVRTDLPGLSIVISPRVHDVLDFDALSPPEQNGALVPSLHFVSTEFGYCVVYCVL